MYLTKYGGMNVAIFEERHEVGGGWTTEESPAPGFLADHCATMHGDPTIWHGPVFDDFPEWIEYGVRHIIPIVATAACFEDGTWCGAYSIEYDPNQERTAELIARFSERDAETWLWLYDKIQRYYRPAQFEWAFNPAQPLGVPDAMDRLTMNPESGIDPSWKSMTYIQVLQDLFESQEVQLIGARMVQSMGYPPDAYGGGLTFPFALTGLLNNAGLMGGTHTFAHASQRIILENGGKIFTRSPVERIIIENGAAKGIFLADGTEVAAKRAVLSAGIDPYQLCVELVGEEHLSPRIIGKIKRLERDWACISWYTWALHERPRYIAESFNPDLPHCEGINLVAAKETGIEDILTEGYRRRQGLWPDPEKLTLEIMDHSIDIPGYAPPGKHCVLSEQYVLPAWRYTEQEWMDLEKRHAEDSLRFWQRFAPNMTWDNVIGYVPVLPYFTAKHARNYGPQHGNWSTIDNTPVQTGRFRPIPELASGRMPIENLYATGAAWHPRPGSHSSQGYIIYKVMADDFGLRKPWEEKGRPY